MPFARIDLAKGKTPEYRATVADVVYGGIVGVLKAPEGDRFMVTSPIIPTAWLLRANFTHTQHRPPQIDCEKCHAEARGSSLTSDVLIPTKQACVECHGPQNIRVAELR